MVILKKESQILASKGLNNSVSQQPKQPKKPKQQQTLQSKGRCSMKCWMLALVLLLLPLERLMPLIPLGVMELHLNLILLIAIAFISFFNVVLRIQKYRITNVDYAILMLSCVYFFVMLFSRDIIESGYLAMHAIFIPLLYYFSIKAIVQNKSSYDIIIKAIVIGALLISVAVIFEFVTDFSRSKPFRIPGISAATLLFMSLPVAAALNTKTWATSRLPLLFISASLVLTLTRAYFVMLLVFPVLRKLMQKGYSFKMGAGLMAATLLLTIAIASVPSSIKPDENIDIQKASTLDRMIDSNYWKEALYHRSFTYQEAMENFKANMFFGVGLYRGEKNVTRHNLHIEWLEYGGLLGYMAYLSVFMAFFWSIRKTAKSDLHVAGFGVGVFGILVNCVTNGIMHGLMPHAVFILMGLCEARQALIYSEKS